MKMIKYFGALSVAGILMICAGCGDPVMPEPPTTDLKPNITIREFLNMFPSDVEYAPIDTALYIEGVVTGNDIGGTIYKKIYMQDTTAGIDIEIEMTQNCNKYPVGQRLVIDLKGLAFGRYRGQPQIRRQGKGATDRLFESECDEHFHRDGYASAANAPEPLRVSMADVTNMSTDPETREQFNMRYCSRLIRVDSVYFAEAGMEFVDVYATLAGNAIDRHLWDADDEYGLVTRISQYALFASDTIPEGFGSVVGILGFYNGTAQLYFRDKNDLIGFEEK
ncbi:MAG: hypothetical protein K2H68_02505 [Bacteroidales bacterium]|nr:hypothetical protein [Bacteroidales bacterium]